MQNVTLATGLNDRPIVGDFETVDANPASRSNDFGVITDTESDIVDDGQPVIRITRGALHHE